MNLIENRAQRPLPESIPDEPDDQLEGILKEIGIKTENEEEEVDADMFNITNYFGPEGHI